MTEPGIIPLLLQRSCSHLLRQGMSGKNDEKPPGFSPSLLFISPVSLFHLYSILYLRLDFKETFFRVPFTIFFFFFPLCSECLHSEQKCGGWIKAAVILGTSSSVSGGSWIFGSLVKTYSFHPLEGPLAETPICTSPGDCVQVHLHARDGFTSLVVFLSHFLLSSLKLLWGFFCSMLMRFKI